MKRRLTQNCENIVLVSWTYGLVSQPALRVSTSIVKSCPFSLLRTLYSLDTLFLSKNCKQVGLKVNVIKMLRKINKGARSAGNDYRGIYYLETGQWAADLNMPQTSSFSKDLPIPLRNSLCRECVHKSYPLASILFKSLCSLLVTKQTLPYQFNLPFRSHLNKPPYGNEMFRYYAERELVFHRFTWLHPYVCTSQGHSFTPRGRNI